MTVAQLAARVGLVFQDADRQIFSGSVKSEVEFGPRNVGIRGDALREAVDGAMRATGLAGAEATNPYDLGGARRKLLALASVLAMETPVLVLDEPTTGQDAPGVERVSEIVESVAAAGRTLIAISHDMRFVAETFERVVVMRDGRVILDGSPAEVFAQRPGRRWRRPTSSRRARRARRSPRAGLDADRGGAHRRRAGRPHLMPSTTHAASALVSGARRPRSKRRQQRPRPTRPGR